MFVIDGISETVQNKGKTVEKILPLNKEELEEHVIDLPISDIEIQENSVIIYTDKKDFVAVQNGLAKYHYHTTEADIQFIPKNTVKLSEENTERLYNLIDALEEDEDVNHVWHNL